MKALIWKEWRENIKWTPLPAILILGPMALFGPAPIMDRGYLFFVSLFSALFGAMLGFLQIHSESQGDKRSLLLHRPLSSSRIFAGKVIAGMGLYVLALGIPFAFELGLVTLPGFISQPFRWPMVLPWLADCLTGFVYYFAGMLTAQRSARWYGSRCLGLGAGVCCSMLVWVLPELWQALLAIVMVGGIVAVAAWGSFSTGGAYAPQPRLAKMALAVTLLLGLSTLTFWAKSYVGRLWEDSGARDLYLLDRQGRVLDIHQRHDEFRVTDLDGQVPREYQGERLDYHTVVENAAHEARNPDLIKRRSYRSCNRCLIEHKNGSRPSNEVWWFVPDQGWLVGYDKQTHRRIGCFGPDGFVPPGEQPKECFQGPLYHLSNFPDAVAFEYLAFPEGVYRVDFHKRTCGIYFVPPAGETVLWASRWENEKKALTLAFVGTDKSIHVLDDAGSRLLAAHLTFDLGSYWIAGVGRLEEPERYWLWFEPQWFLEADALETMSAYLVEYDSAGREIGRRPMPPRPGDARRPDPRMLAFEPSANIVLSGFVTSPAEFALLGVSKNATVAQLRRDHGTQMPILLPFLFYPTQFFLPSFGYLPRTPAGLAFGFAALTLLTAVVSGLACFWLARRFAFARSLYIGWLLCGLLWGLPGLLLMLALHEWPARVACPKCRKLRVVTRDHCEHCGAEHAMPEPDGTEIFEPTAGVPHLAVASQ
jgi:hypothetical protein